MKKVVKINENAIRKMVSEKMRKVLKEDFNQFSDGDFASEDPYTAPLDYEKDDEGCHDYWEDAVYSHDLRKHEVPKGWDKIFRDDDEPLYIDPDGNEFVMDEYGKFVPYNEDDSLNEELGNTQTFRIGTHGVCYGTNPDGEWFAYDPTTFKTYYCGTEEASREYAERIEAKLSKEDDDSRRKFDWMNSMDENRLRRIVNESIKTVINEGVEDIQPAREMCKNALKQMCEAVDANNMIGALPSLIAEVLAESLSEVKLSKNSPDKILYWTAKHCERLMNGYKVTKRPGDY